VLAHPKKTNPPPAQPASLQGLLNQNLPWLYFVKKKKTFREITAKS
jgi:hypothetical protein